MIDAAAELLRGGAILAVKGLGGYHLAVDATSEKAAAALRERKHREDKPFAVMLADVAAARELCEVDEAAARVLSSARRPIVLLPRLTGGGPHGAGRAGAGTGPIAEAVAPGNRQLGIMLPYTPLHHLLLQAVAGPMVLTSGNVSDEPIAYRDEDAFGRLGAIADAYLTHDRAIHVRTDDSVARTFRGREMVLRRSRGYVPEPVTVSVAFRRPVLACGAELKNTFCLAKGNRAFLSHHIGDLENAETLRSFAQGIEHYRRLFGIEPEVVAHDLHPEYLSTKYALDLDGVDLTGVQHHHAHIASCLADNGETGPVIGVAFDGTGYGTDGTIWGGEFLVADLAEFRRAGHLAPVPMPGGAAAVRQPWRMAAVYLEAAFPDGGPAGLDVVQRNEHRWGNVLTLARKGINAPPTSSAGRLFDAVSALLGVRDTINYEGQAAIELEQLAAAGADPGRAEASGYRAALSPGVSGEPFQVRGADLVREAAADLSRGTGRPIVAARFQYGIVKLIEDGCAAVRDRYGLTTVALSGGVFQNVTVLGAAVARLEARGFRVLTHGRVPCNDGGISLGQAVVAAARDAAATGRSAADSGRLAGRGRDQAGQPVVPGRQAGAGHRGQADHRGLRADLADVGAELRPVEVDVRAEVGLGDHDQVRAAEHLRVLERLVGALGDRGEHDPGRLAQVEQRGTDQVPHVLDHDDRARGRGQGAERTGHHGRVEVAAGPGVDLHDLAAGRADPVGVQRGLLVTLDDGQGQLPGQIPAGAFQQGGLARAR